MSERAFSVWRDGRKAKKQGPAAMKQRQRARLAELVAFAREKSPYYRELYGDLPQRIEDSTLLPVTDKKKLMARFDDVVTERDVTLEKVRAFVASPDLIGERFLGKYLAATTSGTSGYQGMFVFDERYLAVSTALLLRAFAEWLTFGEIMKMLGRGMREAQIIATGGHYIAVAGGKQGERGGFGSSHARTHKTFSVTTPLPELVAELNRFRPALLKGYASVVSMLASEREAGRLQSDPVLVLPIAETLRASEWARIAKAFGSKVRSVYGSTECGIAAYSCAEGWYHVNCDWTVLEPVDAEYRPARPGDQSHTVLVSNLANRVMPILRYDLGDSVLERPDPCPCGNRSSAIRVRGRAAEVLSFTTPSGREVSIPPLAFEVDVPGLELLQIVQTTPTSLHVRLRYAVGANPEDVWHEVYSGLTQLLAGHGVRQIAVERAQEPPEQAVGGKYRTIIPLPAS